MALKAPIFIAIYVCEVLKKCWHFLRNSLFHSTISLIYHHLPLNQIQIPPIFFRNTHPSSTFRKTFCGFKIGITLWSALIRLKKLSEEEVNFWSISNGKYNYHLINLQDSLKSVHYSDIFYKRCPKRMLEFYENRIVFL